MLKSVFFEFKTDAPKAFLCPLAKTLMQRPVIDLEGNTFEQAAIEQWLSDGNTVSPITRNPLQSSDLVFNRDLFKAIEEYKSDPKSMLEAPAAADAPPPPYELIRCKLGLDSLTDMQRMLIKNVYSNTGIHADHRLMVADAQCRWTTDGGFRLKVYGEMAQYLHPEVRYDDLNILEQSVKDDAEQACLWVLAAKPNLRTKLDIVNATVMRFAELYPRAPSFLDRKIADDRKMRFVW